MRELALSLSEAAIEAATRVAGERGMSVSALFEQLILTIEARQKFLNSSIGPITKQATGAISFSGDKVERKILEEALFDKYGIKECNGPQKLDQLLSYT